MALAVRDAMFEATNPAMSLLAGPEEGRPRSVLLAKRIPAPAAVEMSVERSLRELEASAKDPKFAEASRKALRKHFAEQVEAEGTAAYWYLRGTAATFPEVLDVVFPAGAALNPARGHVIRASAEEERAMFSAPALQWSGHPLRVLAEGTGADLLVLDDPTGAAARLNRVDKPFVRSVLLVDATSKELAATRDQYRALLRLRSLRLGEVDVLDLLPESPEEAKALGYGPDAAAEQLQRARRLRTLLSRSGRRQALPRGSSPEAAVELVNAAVAKRRRIFLVADAPAEVPSLRLPGQGVLTEREVRRMDPGASFVGLFFGSGAAWRRLDSLTLLGTVRPEPGSSLLSVSLDRGGLSTRRGLAEIDVGGNTVLRAIREASAHGSLTARVYAFDARSLAQALQPRQGGDPESSAADR